MAKFELDRLPDYQEASVLEEIRRVASIIASPVITRREFDKHAKVHSSGLCRRFGSWQKTLERANLADRYSGRTVSEKMRRQFSRTMTADDLLEEIRRVADALKTDRLSQADFNAVSRINARVIISRFGSWKSALEKVGLQLSRHGQRYTDDEYFENLLGVWTFHGRQPRYRELTFPPSRITAGAYEKKWGTWNRALIAFIERVNLDSEPSKGRRSQTATSRPRRKGTKKRRNVRTIPIGVRYGVLKRDRFRCVLCGASPAKKLECNLHVDHVYPVARGGKTEFENLRTLCQDCNLGKSDKIESENAG